MLHDAFPRWLIVTAALLTACGESPAPQPSAGDGGQAGEAGSSGGSGQAGTTAGSTPQGSGGTAGVTGGAGSGGTSTAGQGGAAGESGTSGHGGETSAPSLTISPIETVTVHNGWVTPVQLIAKLEGVQAEIEWSVSPPELATITRWGGTLTPRGTAGGAVTITAKAAGLETQAMATIELTTTHPVCGAPPAFVSEEPAPGKYVKKTLPQYQETGVYHGLYLPPDWKPGQRYPVLIESPCNKYQSFTGKVEDTRLGYYLAGCSGFIWVVVPYLQNSANLDYGWGDEAKTADYWRAVIASIVDDWGGDPAAIFALGFSRGAIGTSYIGLRDEAIADLWLGFLDHSHADGGSLTPNGASLRMERTLHRATFLSWGGAGDGGKPNSLAGKQLLESFGYPVSSLEIPQIGHTDTFIFEDLSSRDVLQSWLFETLAARTGTHDLAGRVTDTQGQGIPGATVDAGGIHHTTTDAAGYYRLRGLRDGSRTVHCLKDSTPCAPDQDVLIAGSDLEGIDLSNP